MGDTRTAGHDYFENVSGHAMVITGPTTIVYRDGRKIRIPLQRPPRAEHFTDREAELDHLLRNLQPGKTMTLCGPGGIGKSALAAEAIWQLASMDQPPERFPDGIVCYSFYGRPNSALAFEHIVRSFDEDVRDTSFDVAFRMLAGKQALLLLDGTEEAEDLPTVLKVRGSCGVIVTSRQRKDAVAERQDIAPLHVDEAMKLIRIWGGDQATDESSIKQICKLVGGLPLAARLVGKYLNESGESTGEYLEWLKNQPLDALHHGEHREESVNVLLQRSVAKLSSDAQQILTVCGAMAFALMSKDVLHAALPEIQLRRPLNELVNYGLLLRSKDRYMANHALIHTYARQRLPLQNEPLERIAAYYEAFVREQQEQGLEGYTRLDAERAHILRIIDACQARKKWQPIHELARSIENYLRLQGYWTEALSVFETGLFASQEQRDRKSEAYYYHVTALIYHRKGDWDKALEYHLKSEQIRIDIGDKVGLGTTYNGIGMIYSSKGDWDKALEYYLKTEQIAIEEDDKKTLGAIYNNTGEIYYKKGDWDKALEYYLKSEQILIEIGDKRSLNAIYNNIGEIYRNKEDWDKALEHYLKTEQIEIEIGDKVGLAWTYNNIGLMYSDKGDWDKASEHYLKSEQIEIEIGDKEGLGATYLNIGRIYGSKGDWDKALEYYLKSEQILIEIGDKGMLGITCWNIGGGYFKKGNLEQALDYTSRAAQIFEVMGSPYLEQIQPLLERVRKALNR